MNHEFSTTLIYIADFFYYCLSKCLALVKSILVWYLHSATLMLFLFVAISTSFYFLTYLCSLPQKFYRSIDRWKVATNIVSVNLFVTVTVTLYYKKFP